MRIDVNHPANSWNGLHSRLESIQSQVQRNHRSQSSACSSGSSSSSSSSSDGSSNARSSREMPRSSGHQHEQCLRPQQTIEAYSQQLMLGSMMAHPPELDRRLQELLGNWLGRDGTRYELTEDTPCSLTVATTRPNGQRRVTRGLISVNLDAMVRWGRNGQYYLEESGLPEAALWCEARYLATEDMPTRNVVFNWSREDDRCRDRSQQRRESSCPPARGFGRPRRRRRSASRSRSRSCHRRPYVL
mmetsp:Transcript_131409/g.252994  ORF Transcript_131409/g.252994 Transcript_131409/m.252994 type:complete len:245 (-) Transcript_131409:22-756(-)